MYLEIFLADFAVFRVFLGISRDFAEIPEKSEALHIFRCFGLHLTAVQVQALF